MDFCFWIGNMYLNFPLPFHHRMLQVSLREISHYTCVPLGRDSVRKMPQNHMLVFYNPIFFILGAKQRHKRCIKPIPVWFSSLSMDVHHSPQHVLHNTLTANTLVLYISPYFPYCPFFFFFSVGSGGINNTNLITPAVPWACSLHAVPPGSRQQHPGLSAGAPQVAHWLMQVYDNCMLCELFGKGNGV